MRTKHVRRAARDTEFVTKPGIAALAMALCFCLALAAIGWFAWQRFIPVSALVEDTRSFKDVPLSGAIGRGLEGAVGSPANSVESAGAGSPKQP